MKNARRAGRVQVADQPAPRHLAHDVLDRGEREGRVGLVVHREEDAGDDLQHQHQQRERAEVVPEVEVLRRVVLGRPATSTAPTSGKRASTHSKSCCAQAFLETLRRSPSAHAPFASSPIRIFVVRQVLVSWAPAGCRAPGSSRTRAPTRSKREPWHGQRKPPAPARPHALVPGRELGGRRAAEVGADADRRRGRPSSPRARARWFLRVLGLRRALRERVGELRLVLLRCAVSISGVAAHDPDRLALPLDDHHPARLEVGDVRLDRRAERARALGGLHAREERPRRRRRSQRRRRRTSRRGDCGAPIDLLSPAGAVGTGSLPRRCSWSSLLRYRRCAE